MTINCTALFCESIREEKSGQDTIVGILPDNIAVPSFPGIFASLSVYVRITFEPTEKPASLAIELLNVDDTQLADLIFDQSLIDNATSDTLKEGNPFVSLIGRMGVGNIPIPAPGRMRLYSVLSGERRLIAALNVKQAAGASKSM